MFVNRIRQSMSENSARFCELSPVQIVTACVEEALIQWYQAVRRARSEDSIDPAHVGSNSGDWLNVDRIALAAERGW